MSSNDAVTPEEKRALSRDELELADQTRPPLLKQLSDRELSDLVTRLRDRRNRARDLADRQGREARGKAEPAGATPAAGNRGTLTKTDYLDAALHRATAERHRRESGDGPSQTELSQKAAALKEEGQTANPMVEDGAPLHPADPDADPGKAPLAGTERNMPPSGAFDHAGNLPARERSRNRN